MLAFENDNRYDGPVIHAGQSAQSFTLMWGLLGFAKIDLSVCIEENNKNFLNRDKLPCTTLSMFVRHVLFCVCVYMHSMPGSHHKHITGFELHDSLIRTVCSLRGCLMLGTILSQRLLALETRSSQRLLALEHCTSNLWDSLIPHF